MFEQLLLALKKRACPEFIDWMYFLSFRIFNNLHLPWKTEFALKIFTALNIVFTFRIFEQLVLALKNRVCPEFTVLNIYILPFIILNNLRLPWKTGFALKFFTVLKYFLSFRIFEQNRVCPEFFKPGGRPPPLAPRLVHHWFECYWTVINGHVLWAFTAFALLWLGNLRTSGRLAGDWFASVQLGWPLNLLRASSTPYAAKKLLRTHRVCTTLRKRLDRRIYRFSCHWCDPTRVKRNFWPNYCLSVILLVREKE